MKYPYFLPPLPYSYDHLEPYIDKLTMEIHHQKHHQGYINNLNKAMEEYPDLQNLDLENIIKNLENIPENIRLTVRNNGGGHLNHTFFWEILQHSEFQKPEGDLLKKIIEDFGSFENFKNEFSETANKHFGSGWAWLVLTKEKKLKIYSLPNQDNPLMLKEIPIMGLDIWEHAYYLKYQNRRTEYVENFWNIINWRKVEENFQKAYLNFKENL